jgi:hypothetical protein
MVNRQQLQAFPDNQTDNQKSLVTVTPNTAHSVTPGTASLVTFSRNY